MFVFVFRYDTPKFYKMKGDQINYQKMMKCIYVYEEGEPNQDNQEDQRRLSIPEEDPHREIDSQDQPSIEMGAINNENEGNFIYGAFYKLIN